MAIVILWSICHVVQVLLGEEVATSIFQLFDVTKQFSDAIQARGEQGEIWLIFLQDKGGFLAILTMLCRNRFTIVSLRSLRSNSEANLALHFLSINFCMNGLRLFQVQYLPCFNPLLIKFFFYFSYCSFTVATLRQAIAIDLLLYARGYVHEEVLLNSQGEKFIIESV